jgi:hypothetical protein
MRIIKLKHRKSEYSEHRKEKKTVRKTDCILAMVIAIIVLTALQGCSSSATVTLIEGTGNESPGGNLGMVVLVKNNLDAGNIGVKVSMHVNNFGDLQGVNNDNVQEVTAKLAKGASIVNPKRSYTEQQYYYYYHKEDFVKGSTCKIVLFYFVKPDMIDENLVFNYDYNTGNKHIKVSKHITKKMLAKSFTEGEINTGNTKITIK